MASLEMPGNRNTIYEPIPASDYIRILTIDPAPASEMKIHCKITSVNIFSVKYAALSYSWGIDPTGDATANSSMIIDGQDKAITQNLYEGLRRIRSEDKQMQIWIDAVCINQDDVLERNAQVAQMATIYRQAETVLVWLGEGCSTAEDAVMEGFLERISKHRPGEDSYHRDSCIASCLLDLDIDCACQRLSGRDHDLDTTSDIDWLRFYVEADEGRKDLIVRAAAAVVAFYSRRYWTRRWVLQELYFARAQIWYWGHCKHTFLPRGRSWVSSLCVYLSRLQTALTVSFPGYESATHIFNEMIRRTEDLVHRAWILGSLLEIIEGHDDNLAGLIASCKDFECGDPRDRVYAIASMSQQLIVPDYKLTVAQTYTYCTRILLESNGFESWLLNLNARLLRNDDAVIECMPSWALDFRQEESFDVFDSPGTWSFQIDEVHEIMTCRMQQCGVVRMAGKDHFALAYEDVNLAATDRQSLETKAVQWIRIKEHRADSWVSRAQFLRLNDVICTPTEDAKDARWASNAFIALRETTQQRGTYIIVAVLDGDRYTFDKGISARKEEHDGKEHDNDLQDEITLTMAYRRAMIPVVDTTILIC